MLRFHRADRRKQYPGLESLEDRQLLSLSAEFTGTLNTTTRNPQFGSDNAMRSDGSSVVVWVDSFSASDHDIRAQRLNASGAKVGPEIVVSGSTLDDSYPAVAIDDHGDFVVTWVQTQANGDSNVLAREYDPNGNQVGSVVQVGVGTFEETNPDVAMDAQGNFAVSYTRNTNGNNPDIFVKRYNHAGQLLNVINAATTARAETRSKIAMSPDGRFDVVWENAFSSSDHDIKLSRYNASGTLMGTNIIAGSTINERTPAVAMDNSGNAVVVWEKSGDIKARRVSANGTLSQEINITSFPDSEYSPAVALRRNGGAFVVSYQRLSTGSDRVKVAEVSAANAVRTFDAGDRTESSISIDGFDHYLLTYTSPDFDIHGRRGFLSS